MIGRVLIEVHGRVQGVGFRPFVYTLATGLGLHGTVQNRGSHVLVDVEGERGSLDAFLARLPAAAPVLSNIEDVITRDAPPARQHGFVILDSADALSLDVRISADVGTCAACLAELFDANDRRYRYPFTNCTNCGPRFTIVRGVPYDRRRTTMAAFAMCDECRREYDDPRDRRFHAQPIACPACGPTLDFRRVDDRRRAAGNDIALKQAAAALRDGLIVAIKGLGGYNLACDARNADAVEVLRRRKRRDSKPFAVMVPEPLLDRLAGQRSPALQTLRSPRRPITLVDEISADALDLAVNVAPGCPALGLMLPYTPLHHLLLHDVGIPLVMTSGNRSDEPIAYDDDDAMARLESIADALLMHDRAIQTRADDSVVAVMCGAPMLVRRARGYAPDVLSLAERTPEPVLSVGGHLKNTFCLVNGSDACLSPHIGDLEHSLSFDALAAMVSHFTSTFGTTPRVVAHDTHPDYLSTRFAFEFPADRRIAVQHHHAHVLSCAAEHRVTDPVIGVAFDGAGLGADGAVWGGEFLIADGARYSRAAHLAYVPMPGGDRAARDGWRMAWAHLRAAFDRDRAADLVRAPDDVGAQERHLVEQLLDRPASPVTSSVGRLFDAVAALIGVRDRSRFEGQAALALEAIASQPCDRRYAFSLDTSGEPWTIDAAPVVRSIVSDIGSGICPSDIASAFHSAVAAMIADVSGRLAGTTGISRIALTGGVFQNRVLTERASIALEARGLGVLRHQRVPCNDGGLSLGQAVAAARTLRAADGVQRCA